ncbi:MAG: hypothetical protein AB7E80_03610 [Hyphomicrobiaceae bacterium]
MTVRNGASAKVGLLALSAIAAATLAPVAASAQANCQWYATTALKQQQQNDKLRCGFAGPEWSLDLARHLSWCGSVPPDVWKTSAQKRDQMLANCSKR